MKTKLVILIVGLVIGYGSAKYETCRVFGGSWQANIVSMGYFPKP